MIIDILIIMSHGCKSRGGSFASTNKLSAGEVRKAPGHRQRLHIRSSSRSVYNPSVIWLRSDKRAIKMEKGTIIWMTLVCLGFIVQLENFSLIRRRHHCLWRAANFYFCLALMAIEQLVFLNVPHLLRSWHPLIMVISEDPWHSHLLPSVWQWSCHYLFLRRRSVAARIRTPNLPLAKPTRLPTAPPPPCTILMFPTNVYFYIESLYT